MTIIIAYIIIINITNIYCSSTSPQSSLSPLLHHGHGHDIQQQHHPLSSSSSSQPPPHSVLNAALTVYLFAAVTGRLQPAITQTNSITSIIGKLTCSRARSVACNILRRSCEFKPSIFLSTLCLICQPIVQIHTCQIFSWSYDHLYQSWQLKSIVLFNHLKSELPDLCTNVM